MERNTSGEAGAEDDLDDCDRKVDEGDGDFGGES